MNHKRYCECKYYRDPLKSKPSQEWKGKQRLTCFSFSLPMGKSPEKSLFRSSRSVWEGSRNSKKKRERKNKQTEIKNETGSSGQPRSAESFPSIFPLLFWGQIFRRFGLMGPGKGRSWKGNKKTNCSSFCHRSV